MDAALLVDKLKKKKKKAKAPQLIASATVETVDSEAQGLWYVF